MQILGQKMKSIENEARNSKSPTPNAQYLNLDRSASSKQNINPPKPNKYSHNVLDDSFSQIQPKIQTDSDSGLEGENYDNVMFDYGKKNRENYGREKNNPFRAN